MREYLGGSWVSPENRWVEIEVWGTRTTQLVGNYYEWDTQASAASSYYYAGDARVAVRRNGVLYYVIGDHLGSTQITVDSSGARASEMRYCAASRSEAEWIRRTVRHGTAARLPARPATSTTIGRLSRVSR